MMGRRSLISIAVLCALAFSAVAAANASAAQKAYTCSRMATVKDYAEADAHCVTNVGAGNGQRGHVFIQTRVIEGGVEVQRPTTVTATNEKTASNTSLEAVTKLRGQLAGVITEVQCTTLHGHGTLINEANFTQGEGTIRYSGCTVTAPAGKECVVPEKIETNNLRATTAGQAAGKLRVEPGPGQPRLARIKIEGCKGGKPPANEYEVTGKVTASVSGATVTTTHAQTTTDAELFFGGVEAGLEGALTFSMAEGTTPNVTAGEAITLT